jgi:hypothetical protein
VRAVQDKLRDILPDPDSVEFPDEKTRQSWKQNLEPDAEANTEKMLDEWKKREGHRFPVFFARLSREDWWTRRHLLDEWKYSRLILKQTIEAILENDDGMWALTAYLKAKKELGIK